MNTLTADQKAFWASYIGTLPESARPVDATVVASMVGNEAIADELLGLYFAGKKTAGSSLVRSFEVAGDPLPKVGDYWMILDSKSRPRALARVVRNERRLFREVNEEVAIAEGEGDLSLAYWRKAHREFFTPFLAELGIADLEEAEILIEYFELVYRA